MKLGELSRQDVARRLRQGGLWFHIGPFVLHVRTPIVELAEALQFSYNDFPLAEANGFADFHVRIVPRPGPRGWWSREVQLFVDQSSPIKPLPRRLAVPLLEWGLNWCVGANVHEYLTIHAAVLERDGLGLILPARCGSGKSTLCAGLVLHGWRLLSDEVTLVRPDDGRLVPLPRPVSLKNRSIAVIRDFSSKARLLGPWEDPVDGALALMRAPTASVERADEWASPAWVVFPRFEPGSPTRSRRCSKGAAFMELASHAPNYSLQGLRGFETMARLVDQCDCYEFRYSDLREAVERFDRLPPPNR